MRIALVSPYSWTYPGGVTRHIDALSGELRRCGQDVNVIAPFDPDDALARRLHRGGAPHVTAPPEGFVSLGRTFGMPANGAVSNLAGTPHAVRALRAQLRGGGYDVVHIHEPVAPLVGWDAMCSAGAVPLVGTFHSYSENRLTNGAAYYMGAARRMNRLHVRIAVSEAAAWTARRFFGGRYTVVPNGVRVDDDGTPREPREAGQPLRVLFIGQAVERKGLPILLSAFEALRDQVPATLTLVGSGPEHVAPLMLEDRGVRALGKVSEERKLAELAQADVLCAPSLGGESFGMVLTEAFASGMPVVASDIAGYRDVVRNGSDGLLVAPGDPVALGRALRAMALDAPMRERMAVAARARAQRFAWSQVADEVVDCYERAVVLGQASGRAKGVAVRYGLAPADGLPSVPRIRQPAPGTRAPVGDSAAPQTKPGRWRIGLGWAVAAARGAAAHVRVPRAPHGRALGASLLVALGLSVGGLADVGVRRVEASLAGSKPGLITAGLALMSAAMLLRALSWHAILRSAPTWRRARLGDAVQGTCIGVLMSATLPARMGEPARALIVARRLGRVRETLPVVLGTVVSQMLLNLLAVVILAVVTLTGVRGQQGDDLALLVLAASPVAALMALLLAPAIVPGGRLSRPMSVGDLVGEVRAAMRRVRGGLHVFGHPPKAAAAVVLQLGAWAVQWISCWLLLDAVGLSGPVGLGGAAAVLFAINLTAILPITPANVGIFQLAVVTVLVGGYHVAAPAALAFGIVLQAVEIATALGMGMPALAREGLSWRELRMRTVHAASIKLGPVPSSVPAAENASAVA